jgi:hypothetical protein
VVLDNYGSFEATVATTAPTNRRLEPSSRTVV